MHFYGQFSTLSRFNNLSLQFPSGKPYNPGYRKVENRGLNKTFKPEIPYSKVSYSFDCRGRVKFLQKEQSLVFSMAKIGAEVVPSVQTRWPKSGLS